jgi:hypothetical protein
VGEHWSIHASEEACDLAMRAPGAGRVAADEVFVRGSIAEDLRAAVVRVDPEALIRDATEGWAEIVVAGGDARATFARLSDLRLPDAPGYVQGDVARVAARVFVEEDAVHLYVQASVGADVRRYVDEGHAER